MSECEWYTCTYSRQLTRLNKTYTDGFLCVRNDNHIRLFAENDLARPIDSAFLAQATKHYVDAESDGRVIEKFHVRCDPDDKLQQPPPSAPRQTNVARTRADAHDVARPLAQTLISRPYKRPRTETNAAFPLQQQRVTPRSLVSPLSIDSAMDAADDETLSMLFPADATDTDLTPSQTSIGDASALRCDDAVQPPSTPVVCHAKRFPNPLPPPPPPPPPLPLFDGPLVSNLTSIMEAKPLAPLSSSGLRSRLTFRLSRNQSQSETAAKRQRSMDDHDSLPRPSPPAVAPAGSCPLKFPSLTTTRIDSVPDTFSSAAQYAATFQALILEQVSAQLQPTSKRFLTCYRTLFPHANTTTHARPSPTRDVQEEYRRNKVAYYDSKHTTLIRVATKKTKKWKPKAKSSVKRATNDASSKESDDDGVESSDESGDEENANKFWLKVDSRHRDNVMAYARGDVWILSNHPHLMTQDAPLSPAHFCCFVTALYHSFSVNTLADGFSSMQVKLIPIQGNSSHMTSHSAKVYGVRLGNFSSDMAFIDMLAALNTRTLAVLPIVLSADDSACNLEPLTDRSVTHDDIAAVHEQLAHGRKLNADQLEVVNCCIRWLQRDHSSERPIQLVHGVFGSGKSFLLVSIVFALSRLLDVVDPKRKVRILIAALTNVAVDNVLTGLKTLGFDDFCRVGVLKRVAKPVLQHVLHHAADSNKTQDDADQLALKELREELRRLQSSDGADDDVRHVNAAILDLSQSASKSRARRLRSRRVVGTTCASALSSALTGQTFSIVLLDECSQMTEPASLIPMTRFGCQRLVAVGDPKQLPPTLQDINENDDTSNTARALLYRSALSRTLFVRLQSAGLQTILLRTQYRCHPLLTKIANELFYDKQIIDGVDEQQRAPLLVGDRESIDGGTETTYPPLPPLVFVHVNGREVKQNAGYQQRDDDGGSTYNAEEVDAVTTIVHSLLTRGIAPQQIGVITFYKAQQMRLRNAVSSHNDVRSSLVPVATVDSFQGGEFDVIVLSTTRTMSIGFAADSQRMNVALSRARHHLIIVGHAHCLQSADEKWKFVLATSRRQTSSYHPNLSSLMALISRTDITQSTTTNTRQRRHIATLDEDEEQQGEVNESATHHSDVAVAKECAPTMRLLLDDDE